MPDALGRECPLHSSRVCLPEKQRIPAEPVAGWPVEEVLGHGLERAGKEEVVAVQETEDLPCRASQPRIDRVHLASVFRALPVGQASRMLCYDVAAAVGTAPIDDNVLQGGVTLAQDRQNRLLEVATLVEGRRHDGDGRPLGHSGSIVYAGILRRNMKSGGLLACLHQARIRKAQPGVPPTSTTCTDPAGMRTESEPLAISLVVPLFNEERTIDSLLTSLVAQTLQPWAVIFVDAGSTDRTAGILEQFRAPFPSRVLRRGRLNPGEARNEGVREASTEWVAFTDGGIALASCWLSELDRSARSGEADVVFGTYDPTCDTFFRRCAALAYVPARGSHGIRGPSVVSMAIRRGVFWKAGGFPAYRAAEDLIFLEILAQTNARAAYAPNALALWQTAPSAGTTFRRFLTYSEANVRAGRARSWHLGVARQYVVVGSAVLALVAAGEAAFAGAVVLTWMAGRTLRAAIAKRGSLPFDTLSPIYLAGAASVLVTIDAATACGVLRWVWKGIAAHAREGRD